MLRGGVGRSGRQRLLCSAIRLNAVVRRSSHDFSDSEQRRAFLDRLAEKHGVKQRHQWQHISERLVLEEEGGAAFLGCYGDSLSAALREFYAATKRPQSPIAPVERRGAREWERREDRKALLDALAQAHNVRQASDWQRISVRDVEEAGGSGLLALYEGSLLAALRATYPEAEGWDEWQVRKKVANGFWEKRENARRFLEEVAKRHGVVEAADWKKVTREHIGNAGGRALLLRHGTMQAMLAFAFPELSLSLQECRASVPRGHWKERSNRRAFFERLAEAHGVRSPEDWRRVTKKAAVKAGGSAITNMFGGSLTAALRDSFPEQEWEETLCRPTVGQRYWGDLTNQRRFLDELAAQRGVQSPAQWMAVSHKDVIEAGGTALLSRYGNSLHRALLAVYGKGESSEEAGEWAAFRCRPNVAASWWQEDRNVRAFLEEAATWLQVERSEDWLRVSRKQLLTVPGGGSFLNSSIGLHAALCRAYPDQDWSSFSAATSQSTKKAAQRELMLVVRRLFPDDDISEDHKHQGIARKSLASVELDLYLPGRQLAFEYQGRHHYDELAFFSPLELVQKRDQEKRKLCEQMGIRLVEVPFWWDNQLESLAAAVHTRYPSVLVTEAPATVPDASKM